jgi:hypothetical protein
MTKKAAEIQEHRVKVDEYENSKGEVINVYHPKRRKFVRVVQPHRVLTGSKPNGPAPRKLSGEVWWDSRKNGTYVRPENRNKKR